MFTGFSRIWTPVALAGETSGPGPFPVTVAGEPIVLFRGADGRLGALHDRCPHRGVALSLGKVSDGCIRCPFHGWRFRPDGTNVEVPWHPDARRDQLGATSLPVRETGGLVWLHTGPEPAGGAEPELPAEVLRPDVRLSGETVLFRAHWTRVVENMLDDSHLPFVHPRSIGRGFLPRPEATLETRLREEPWGLSWRVGVDGVMQNYDAEFRWPNMMLLRIPVPDRLLAIYFAAVPVDAHHTRVIQLGVRGFLRWRIADPLFRWMNRRVLAEDRAVIESVAGPVPEPGAERSVPTDAVSLQFRRRYLRELARPATGPGHAA